MQTAKAQIDQGTLIQFVQDLHHMLTELIPLTELPCLKWVLGHKIMITQEGNSSGTVNAKAAISANKWATVSDKGPSDVSSNVDLNHLAQLHRQVRVFVVHMKDLCITKTRLFKYIENYTTKNWKFSDKNSDIFIVLLIRITLVRQF